MKNIILIVTLFFIYSCGYTATYKNLKELDINVAITEMKGDTAMNDLIKNQIKSYSNMDSKNKFNVAIDTKYQKVIIAKDTAGVASDYQLSSNSTFSINFNGKSKLITFNEIINIKKQTDTFEQNIYERNIRRNFAASLREKLISEILTLK